MLQLDTKVYIAGHRGMVGSAIKRDLERRGYRRLITRNSVALDLTNQQAVERFFAEEKPQCVILAAARVGGSLANDRSRADFLYENLMIESNVIHAAHRCLVEKLLFLGSSCSYPKLAPQPLREEYLLSGALEATNEPYAIAKIAGVKLCENYHRQYGCNFVSALPCNLYGPADHFDLETAHVLPALIRKFDEAARRQSPAVQLWGTGTPRQEFLYVEDLADAVHFVLQNVNAADLRTEGISHLNIGSGEEFSIAELARLVAAATGYAGEIVQDRSKPDGTPRRLLDVSRLRKRGWMHRTSLEDGIEQAYRWFRDHRAGRRTYRRQDDPAD